MSTLVTLCKEPVAPAWFSPDSGSPLDLDIIMIGFRVLGHKYQLWLGYDYPGLKGFKTVALGFKASGYRPKTMKTLGFTLHPKPYKPYKP